MLKEYRGVSVLRELNWSTVGVMLASALGMICGISALRFTTVAEAMVIYATKPFMTAAVAWLVIGERPSWNTILASFVALCGVGVMLIDAQWGNSMIGRVLAFGSTLSMAFMTTIMRRSWDIPMLPAVAGSAWLCSAVCLPFAMPLGISPLDLSLCAAFGVVQNAAGLALYTLGSRRVLASGAWINLPRQSLYRDQPASGERPSLSLCRRSPSPQKFPSAHRLLERVGNCERHLPIPPTTPLGCLRRVGRRDERRRASRSVGEAFTGDCCPTASDLFREAIERGFRLLQKFA